jgi:hypothetical protein
MRDKQRLTVADYERRQREYAAETGTDTSKHGH